MASKKESIPATCSDTSKILYSCDECETTLTSLAKLNYHKQAHKKIKSMTCNICEKVFACSGNLARHQRIHTGDLVYKCQVCSKAFNQATHRSRHMKLVHRVKNIPSSMNCETDNKQCNKTQKKDRWTTSMVNGYECDVCGKNFKKAQSLKVHKKSHPSPRPSVTLTTTPFLCEFCGKAFKRSGTLAAHKMQHDRKKLSFCDICKKGYSTAQALVVHTRTHTGERPYKCDLCATAFRQQGHLKQHMDTVHSKEKKRTSRSKISARRGVTFTDQKQHNVSTKSDENGNHDQLPPEKVDPISGEGNATVRPNKKKSKMNPISRKYKQSRATYQISMKNGAATIPKGKQVAMRPVFKKLNKQMEQHDDGRLNQLEGEIKPESAVRQISEKSNNLAHHSWHDDSLNKTSEKSEKLVAQDNEKNQDPSVGVNTLKNSEKSDHLDLNDANQPILSKSAVGPCQCDICGKIFKQRSYVKIHKRIHTGEKPFSCGICGHSYRFMHHLKYHLNNTNCGKPTGQLETSDREEPSRTFNYDGTSHNNANCGQSRGQPETSDTFHVDNADCSKPTGQPEKSDREEPRHTCNYDDTSHDNNANYGQSISQPETSDMFHVDNADCGKPTGQPEKSDGEESRCTCDYCGNIYENASLLEMHQRCHEDDTTKEAKSKPSDGKPYKCQFCPKAFNSKAHIDMHERVHTGSRPYQCDLCSKAFKQATHLSCHRMRIHHKAKGKMVHTKTIRKPENLNKKNPYKLCAKTLKLDKKLRLHNKMHKLRPKPFECAVCGKAFEILSNLDRHQLVHTGEKPFVCEICGKGCTQKSNLDGHMKRVHKNSNPVTKSDKLQIGHEVQIDSNSDKRSIEASYVKARSKKDSEESQLHEDSKAKSRVNKKRNLLLELSKLRFKNVNSRVENSSNSNRSCEESENANKASDLKECNQPGGAVANKESEVKEDYPESKHECTYTRIAKSKINNLSSGGEFSTNAGTRDTKCDETFENISTEKCQRHQLNDETEQNMFVCCECGERFEQERCMMEHCVDVH